MSVSYERCEVMDLQKILLEYLFVHNVSSEYSASKFAARNQARGGNQTNQNSRRITQAKRRDLGRHPTNFAKELSLEKMFIVHVELDLND